MKHHPSSEILKKFSGAELNESLSAVVAAHIEQCSECRNLVGYIEKTLASELQVLSDSSDEELDNNWENILSRLDEKPKPIKSAIAGKPADFTISDQTFEMPRSLKNIDVSNLKWMSFGKTGKITRLKGNETSSLLLIYLGPNEDVPFHSHAGAEYSYVISGSFAADGMEFQTGDFSFSDQTINHSPRATSPDGCLLVSNIEERLNFFSGTLKPLNRIVWKFLNWKFSRL